MGVVFPGGRAGRLAASAEYPNAMQAAGLANGQNSLSIIIPCHQGIRINGDIGGYSSGTDIKR